MTNIKIVRYGSATRILSQILRLNMSLFICKFGNYIEL